VDAAHREAQDGCVAGTAERSAGPSTKTRQAPPWLPLAAGLAGLAVAAAAAAVALAASVPILSIAADQIVGLAYIGAGAVAWRRRPENRTGRVILLAGFTWYIASFQVSEVAVVAALSFAFAWVVNAIAAYLLLSYPEGVLFSRPARVLFGFIVANTVVQAAARLLLVGTASEYGCDCANPFGAFANAEMFDVIMLVTRLIAVVLTLAVLVLIVRRWRRASGTSRRQLNLVLVAGAVGVAAFASDILIFMTQAYPLIEQAIFWTVAVARAAVPIGFMAGLVQMRMDRGLIANLVVELGGVPSHERLQAVVSRTVHDPSLAIAYWSRSTRQFVDADGQAVDLPRDSSRGVRVVERDGVPLCALVYDPALSADPELLDGVAAALALALDRSRLESMVHAQASEVRHLPTGLVTFLHADIEGSTELLERLGDRYADLLSEERRILRQICRAAGGREVDSRADEFFAVFPAGSSPADAAIGIQRRLRTQAWPDGVAVKVRIGLHAGNPQLAPEGYVGVDVHIAARIGAAGHGGQVLVSSAAADLIAPTLDPAISLVELGTFELKGLSDSQRIFQLLAPDLPAKFPALRPPARFAAAPTLP
jgi:class 3 adenylate cyclase